MEIENWGIHANLKKEIEEHYKTKYALSLVDTEPISIAEKLTFDGFVSSVTVDDLTEFLETLNTQFLHGGIRGVGLEIGSGPGTFVAALARFPEVNRVYGVEACEAIINELMTKVVRHIAEDNEEKVVGAIADFDNLELPDNSVDFVFDFFSLHHSPNPAKTLREIYRVLKPGGVMFCIDKARANSLSPRELDALLDIEYTAKTKKDMGLPIDVRHTRRMNGEHEYRLNDWKKYFADAELSNFKHYNVAKIGGTFIVQLIKKLLALLPINLQSNFSRFFSKKITNNLEPSNRIFTAVLPFYPREFSLMIAWKK
jgi:SAM-dependent methyltransferase